MPGQPAYFFNRIPNAGEGNCSKFWLLNCRDAMMEEMADRHVLSRNYAKWKIMYETEQKNGVASLHYK